MGSGFIQVVGYGCWARIDDEVTFLGPVFMDLSGTVYYLDLKLCEGFQADKDVHQIKPL